MWAREIWRYDNIVALIETWLESGSASRWAQKSGKHYFDVKLPSILLSDRVSRFEKKFADCNNTFFLQISASVR